MKTFLLACAALVSSLTFLTGCGSSSDTGSSPQPEEHGFTSDTDGWTETLATTSAWPWFGGGNSGVVTAPRWQAPKHFGCEKQIYERQQPSTGLQPGDAPRTVYGDELGETCRAPGTVIDVIDRPAYEDSRFVDGSCAGGFQISTVQGAVAAVQLGADLPCTSFAASRADAASRNANQKITLRLVSVTPAVMEVTAVADDTTEGGGFAVKER